jgi:hypothetical protein
MWHIVKCIWSVRIIGNLGVALIFKIMIAQD